MEMFTIFWVSIVLCYINQLSGNAPWCVLLYYFTLPNAEQFYSSECCHSIVIESIKLHCALMRAISLFYCLLCLILLFYCQTILLVKPQLIEIGWFGKPANFKERQQICCATKEVKVICQIVCMLSSEVLKIIHAFDKNLIKKCF